MQGNCYGKYSGFCILIWQSGYTYEGNMEVKNAGDYSGSGHGKAFEGADQREHKMHGKGKWSYHDRKGTAYSGQQETVSDRHCCWIPGTEIDRFYRYITG